MSYARTLPLHQAIRGLGDDSMLLNVPTEPDPNQCVTQAVHDAAVKACSSIVLRGLGLVQYNPPANYGNPCWLAKYKVCPPPTKPPVMRTPPRIAEPPKRKRKPVTKPPVLATPAPRPAPPKPVVVATPKPVVVAPPVPAPTAPPPPVVVAPDEPPEAPPAPPPQPGFSTAGILAVVAAAAVGGWLLFGKKKKQPA